MNYYLHRISHEWDVSKKLFDMGYLSIGWSRLNNSNIEEVVRRKDKQEFDRLFLTKYDRVRSMTCLYRFLSFEEGDIVVVPLYDKQCAIVKISNGTVVESVLRLPEHIKKAVGYTDMNDIGFVAKFDLISLTQRSYTPGKLQSRMKIRQTNAEINELDKEIKAAEKAESKKNLQDLIRKSVTERLLLCIRDLNDREFEKLVRWYMVKAGATEARIPGKNSGDKIAHEDADVIAEFEPLNTIFIIQAKDHKGETSRWAVEQIQKFKEWRTDPSDGYTYIPWVISACDSFSSDAIKLAQENYIRLIDGRTFVQMLLDVGIEKINEAF